ncbi:unnamed protein product [Pylaiella littoralis]
MGRCGALEAGLAAFVIVVGDVVAFSPSALRVSSVPGSTGRSSLPTRSSCTSRRSCPPSWLPSSAQSEAARAAAAFGRPNRDEVFLTQGENGRFQLCATSAAIPPESFSGGAGDDAQVASTGGGKTRMEKLKAYPGAMYKFTRPHTIRGTILASVTGVARALMESPNAISLDLVPKAVLGLLALLLGNAFIVGINQIYDMEIDKINKPELPVASGEISKRLAWVLVLASLAAGPAIVYTSFSALIFRLYSLGIFVGGLYSVPPFSFKRFPVVAGLTIACVRGFLLNFGVYYAVREALGVSFRWNPVVLFLSRFMVVFAGVIAVTKDLPDVKGDRKYNISTFASKRGVKFTARAASAVLAVNYVSAIAEGALSPAGAFNRRVMIGGHSALLVVLGFAIRKLVPDDQDSIKGFYKRIWDLFYLEYAMYPFM